MKLITSKTEAVTSAPASWSFEGNLQICIMSEGLSAGESVTVQYSIDGTVWTDLKQYGRTITLTEDNNCIGIYAPAMLRVVKGVTLNPVTIAVNDKINN